MGEENNSSKKFQVEAMPFEVKKETRSQNFCNFICEMVQLSVSYLESLEICNFICEMVQLSVSYLEKKMEKK